MLFLIRFLIVWGMGETVLTASPLTPLLEINHYNPMEPAFSRGSLGLKFGLGWEQLTWNENEFAARQVFSSEEQPSSEVSVLNAYIHKGTPYPVDFGLVFSQALDSSITRAGAHLQWTLFQGFRLPSFAIRAQGSKVFGLNSTSIEGLGGSAILDYGFWRINLIASASLQLDQVRYNREANPNFQLKPTSTEETNISYSTSYGFGLTLLPGVLELSCFAQSFKRQEDRYMLKILFGM